MSPVPVTVPGVGSAGGRSSALPTPRAARLRRPSWHDTRLLVGLMLVTVSVLAGSRVVAEADRTVPVWAAARTLVAGSVLAPEALVAVRVRLGRGAAPYLDGTRVPAPGLALTRPVGEGELIPRAAVVPAVQLRLRAVTVPIEGPAPSELRAGVTVDVWISDQDREAGRDTYRPPRLLLEGVQVQAVTADSGRLSVGGERAAELLLGEEALPDLLDALANGARAVLLPVPGSAPPGRDR